ncbi:hypothetical protein [Emticicia agri]|uniref:Uncharacterized protein n=1 Tax=Emticicia agri TaxID=2492393 RepID=A0A4Q5LQM5_9BACT|nr:hypothetical protein [Emticicia agri]RYU91786.1 hypothetical protein EWM59_26780 [Emticicia agri]
MKKYKYFKPILILLLITSIPTFSQNFPEVKKEKTLLDFAFGMTNKEFIKHLNNLMTSYIIHDYRYDFNTGHHEFSYSFPVENLNSDFKVAEARIRAKPDPYLLSMVASIVPPIDSSNKGTQKLYEAFKKHYGKPIKPLKKERNASGVFL